MCIYTNTHRHIFTHTAHSGRPHGHTCVTTHVLPSYMPGTTPCVCARSHLTRTQLAIHTLPVITHTSHMHSQPSATCHYSQPFKRREALKHALRQRRDLVAVEIPAQAHTQGESGEVDALCTSARETRVDALPQKHARDTRM